MIGPEIVLLAFEDLDERLLRIHKHVFLDCGAFAIVAQLIAAIIRFCAWREYFYDETWIEQRFVVALFSLVLQNKLTQQHLRCFSVQKHYTETSKSAKLVDPGNFHSSLDNRACNSL
jgi:hypothetical protein